MSIPTGDPKAVIPYLEDPKRYHILELGVPFKL